MGLFGTKSQAEREAVQAKLREAAEQSHRRAIEAAGPGYSWTWIASINEPLMQHPTCDTCGAHVPVKNHNLHTEWHRSLS